MWVQKPRKKGGLRLFCCPQEGPWILSLKVGNLFVPNGKGCQTAFSSSEIRASHIQTPFRLPLIDMPPSLSHSSAAACLRSCLPQLRQGKGGFTMRRTFVASTAKGGQHRFRHSSSKFLQSRGPDTDPFSGLRPDMGQKMEQWSASSKAT